MSERITDILLTIWMITVEIRLHWTEESIEAIGKIFEKFREYARGGKRP